MLSYADSCRLGFEIYNFRLDDLCLWRLYYKRDECPAKVDFQARESLIVGCIARPVQRPNQIPVEKHTSVCRRSAGMEFIVTKICIFKRNPSNDRPPTNFISGHPLPFQPSKGNTLLRPNAIFREFCLNFERALWRLRQHSGAPLGYLEFWEHSKRQFCRGAIHCRKT
jgi:hypothetical protein